MAAFTASTKGERGKAQRPRIMSAGADLGNGPADYSMERGKEYIRTTGSLFFLHRSFIKGLTKPGIAAGGGVDQGEIIPDAHPWS